MPDSSRTSSSPGDVRSDEEASGIRRDFTKSQNKSRSKKKKDNKEAAVNRLRDLPEWLEEFTDNLEDTEVHAPAHISQDSDSELPTNVASRKHSIYTRFPKDSNCEVCKRTKMTRALCRKRNGEAEKIW